MQEIQKEKNFVYEFNNNLYINLTNRCSNKCSFCIRNSKESIGHNGSLWLISEPAPGTITAELKRVFAVAEEKGIEYDEVVFCGYGEPTYKLSVILKVAQFLKANKKKVRLNTNGLGNMINGDRIVKHLAKVIDSVSVSLNASTKEEYFEICKPKFGLFSFSYIISFIKECVAVNIDTTVTVVDMLDKDKIAECKKIATELGAKFRLRKVTDY